MRMVASSAGSGAANIVQIGLLPNGGTNQPLPGKVGWNFSGTESFGVRSPPIMSTELMEMMAIMTAKSLTTCRTYGNNRIQFLLVPIGLHTPSNTNNES